MPRGDGTGPNGSGSRGGQGGGRGGMSTSQNVQGAGRGGFPQNCRCPSCGNIEPHRAGVPCSQAMCSKCGSPMVRG